MPKSKEFVATDSDDSSSDQEVKTKKNKRVEAKEEKSEPPKKKEKTNNNPDDDDEDRNSWEISKNRRISVSNYRGKTYVNIREYYEKDGKMLPGRKGISLNTEQWKTLCSHIDKVNEAL